MKIFSVVLLGSLFAVILACFQNFSYDDTTEQTTQADPLLSRNCPVPRIKTIAHTSGFRSTAGKMVFLDPVKYPQAKCNDGSPAVYIIRPGFGAAQNRWLIELSGGGGCTQQDGCSDRAKSSPELVSSVPYRGGKLLNILSGIESTSATANPDFYDATTVRISYCSSDLWSGNHEGDPSATFPDMRAWHFHGRAIVDAVIADLKEKYNLNAASEVLLQGGSSGGMGVLNSITRIKSELPSTTRLLGLADASYFIVTDPFDQRHDRTLTGQPNYMAITYSLGPVVWESVGDDNCTAKGLTASECINAVNLSHGGFLRVPIFFRQSKSDSLQLYRDGLRLGSDGHARTANGLAYQENFKSIIANGMPSINPWHAIFATNEITHTALQDPQFNGIQDFGSAGSYSIRTALSQWYRNPCGPRVRLNQ